MLNGILQPCLDHILTQQNQILIYFCAQAIFKVPSSNAFHEKNML